MLCLQEPGAEGPHHFRGITWKLRKGFAVGSLFRHGYIIATDGKHHTVALSDGTAEDVLSL